MGYIILLLANQIWDIFRVNDKLDYITCQLINYQDR